MECVVKQKKDHCPCSCTNCARHGNCCACVVYHRQKQEIPGCFFSPAGEKVLDRSLSHFIKDRSV